MQKLSAEGARVLAVDVNGTTAAETASQCPSGSVRPFTADITLESSWRSILSTTLEHFFNRVDVVVNCAGVVHVAAPSHEVPEEEFDKVFKVNVKPLYLSTKVIVPWWKEKKQGGLFVNLSSISEPRPRPNLVWYAASKGAVTVVSSHDPWMLPLHCVGGLTSWDTKTTKGLAAEYAVDQIRYNCVRPAVGETAM